MLNDRTWSNPIALTFAGHARRRDATATVDGAAKRLAVPKRQPRSTTVGWSGRVRPSAFTSAGLNLMLIELSSDTVVVHVPHLRLPLPADKCAGL
jgi:hypothetical protein